jgi:hypothetical protein
MALKDFFFNKNTPKQEMINIKTPTSISTFSTVFDSLIQQEMITRTSKGYLFGTNGLYPNELNGLYNQSPLHSAIINFKKMLTTGNGYTVVEKPQDANGIIALNQLTTQFDEMLNDIAQDLYLHSRIHIKVTWNSNNTKILKLERISPEKIRINEVDELMKPISYLYNWDWLSINKFNTITYPKFDPYNKKDKVQLFTFDIKTPGMKLYPIPTYESAIPWIILDAEMAQYHKANITNSVNPSLLIQYYEKPGSQEEKQQVLIDLNNSFAGARKTGRSMITFSDGKDLAPTVTQMEPNKLDKTFLQLNDTIQRQITYSHNIDPQLLGLKTPGSLGNSGEFIYSYNLFNLSVIQPTQLDIERILNNFISLNGIPAKIKLNDVDINKINPTLPIPEVAVKTNATNKVEVVETESVIVNDNLKNLTGKQHQALLRIIRQYGQGKLTKDQATVMLKSGLGMNQEEIELMLNDNE